MDSIEQFEKLMIVLKDVKPTIYHIFEKKNVRHLLYNLPTEKDRKNFLTLLSLTIIDDKRKELLKILTNMKQEVGI
jgi:hypothetical protein